MAEKQKTISKEISLKGKGLHSGKVVNLTFKPAGTNHGYRFRRIDLDGQPVVRALAENVTTTARGTTIQEGIASVMTIEHCCAALYGMAIDNIMIEVDGPEVPILDGSSKYFIKALKEVGIIDQDADKKYLTIKEKIVFCDEKHDIEIVLYPDDHLSIDVHIDFNSKTIGCQYALLPNIQAFESEISSCKTFVFLHELEALAKNNLVKGGDLENALIIVDRPMAAEELDKLSLLFNQPKVEVLPEGILNNTELTFQNEPARHKLLDVLGDIALIGMPLKAKIIARKPGHYANTEMAKIIRKLIKNEHS